MGKVEEAITLFDFWRKKFRIKPIPFKQDNRESGHFVSHFEDNKAVRVTYNSKNLKEWNYPMILSGIFHEIGHLRIPDHPYETERDKVEEEYLAESYSIKMVKKYYPFMLKGIVEYQKHKMNSSKFRRSAPIHFKAFSQIKEYMI